MRKTAALLAWTFCCTFVQPLKLPDYIKPCRRYAPDIQECMLKAARDTIPHVIHGDPKYRIPPLDPVRIEEFVVNQGTSSVGLTLSGHDAEMRGVKDVVIKSMHDDFEKQEVTFEWFFPEIRIDCNYNVTGRILLLPIEGHGKGTITLIKSKAHYVYHWDFKKKKDGKEYYTITRAKLTVEPEKLTINLQNLFNGNKLLGDNMNKFINENWRELFNEVGPTLADALGEYIRSALNNIYDLVPRENVFIYDPV